MNPDEQLGAYLGEWLRETIQPIIEEVVDRKIQEYQKKKNPTYLTIMETCQKLGICEATFHNWARKGLIEKIEKNGKIYVNGDVLDEKIEFGDIGRYVHKRR